jgi:hypothetical protein
VIVWGATASEWLRLDHFRATLRAAGEPHAKVRVLLVPPENRGFVMRVMESNAPIAPLRPEDITDPKQFHDRAEEARILASEMRDNQAKEMMLKVAKTYDGMATTAEMMRRDMASLRTSGFDLSPNGQ